MAGYSVTYSVVDNATKQIDAINRRVAAMRAPMERLSKQVSRFMDVSGLNTIAKGFASIGRAAVSVVRTLAEMIPLLGTITGAATIAGMAKLVGSYADWSQQLTATADNLGKTTQQLQQFEDATRLAGGKSSDMDAALKALYKTQTDFVRGQASADQIGWLNRLGISVKDANGNLRTMADLMPEVVRKIGEIKNPADRAAASAALLGDANDTLVETFRRSHQSFGQWMTDASKYTELSDKQKDQLQAFSEAQGHIATAFDHLGQQISATLATNFTPLLNTLADFVEKNQPAIIAAVDHISDEFKNWISGIDWEQVKEDIKGITSLLRIMLDVAEAIGKAIQKTMLLFGLVNRKFTKEDVLQNSPFYAQLDPEQQKMVRQQVGISEEDYAKGQQPQPGTSFTAHPLDWLGNRLFRGGQGNEGYQTPTGRGPAPSQQAPGPTAPASPAGPPAPLAPGAQKSAFYDEQRQLIYDAAVKAGVAHPDVVAEVGATQATLESGGGQHTPTGAGGFNVYGIKSGGGVGGVGTPVSTQEEGAGGRYTTQASFATFQNKQDAAEAYVDFLKKHPSHYAPVLAAGTVEEGLQAQGRSGYATASNYLTSLQATQRTYGGNATPPTQVAQAGALPVPPIPPAAAAPPVQVAQATAPPATVPPAAPANGVVDVNVTHKNPPPNTAITASATGPGVNVAPPRVEHQELASI
jgi:flagellum-specific peptidoglycan hydrolase FlgJ